MTNNSQKLLPPLSEQCITKGTLARRSDPHCNNTPNVHSFEQLREQLLNPDKFYDHPQKTVTVTLWCCSPPPSPLPLVAQANSHMPHMSGTNYTSNTCIPSGDLQISTHHARSEKNMTSIKHCRSFIMHVQTSRRYP